MQNDGTKITYLRTEDPWSFIGLVIEEILQVVHPQARKGRYHEDFLEQGPSSPVLNKGINFLFCQSNFPFHNILLTYLTDISWETNLTSYQSISFFF